MLTKKCDALGNSALYIKTLKKFINVTNELSNENTTSKIRINNVEAIWSMSAVVFNYEN